MIDFETWLHDVGYNRVFRMLKLRRVGDWTPYEMEQKFIDESQYESGYYSFVKIIEAIELPDKDILIGYKEILEDTYEIDDEDWKKCPIHYKKLSQIELSFYPNDEMEEN